MLRLVHCLETSGCRGAVFKVSDSDSIVVGFDWQPGEHAEVVQILTGRQFRSVGWRATKWMVALASIGWLALGVADIVRYGDASLLLGGLPWLLFVGFWYWIFLRLAGSNAARQTRNLNADVHYPFVHRFDNSGLRIDGFGATVELRWEGMTEIREEDGFFLFFWNPKCAYFTPKRVIPIENQNRLRTLAEKKLGADAHVRPLITSGTR